MGYGNKVSLDIYAIGREQKVCTLYDSDGDQIGAAHSIKRNVQQNGWKEITFTLPVRVNGELNWRLPFITNEYELRVHDGDEIDWYRLTEPTDSDNGAKAEVKVICPHCSALLKKRNIYLEFTDENGIGTIDTQLETALEGSGWMLGHCDVFYEPDGVTQKVRTYTCGEKTGAYEIIQGICDKFVAYPVFHGDSFIVDVYARAAHEGLLELMLNKNLAQMSRTRDSSDIITRLYVEGEYGDLGYVGIDDVNPTGLNYLMNFDYYKEIGALSETQEDALIAYPAAAASVRSEIMTTTAANEASITQLQTDWGAQKYVIYPVVNGSYGTPVYGNGATSADGAQVGDSVASVTRVSADTFTYQYRTLTSPIAPVQNEAWIVKFVTPNSGTLGGKEVAIEAKNKTIDTLIEARDRPGTSDQEAAAYQTQINEETAARNAIKAEADTLMVSCITLAEQIDSTALTIAGQKAYLGDVELDFIDAMGEMLQDGYYSDQTYAPGQEEALYNDSVELMKVLSRPQLTYELKEKDIANCDGYTDEIFALNMAVRFYNADLNINDYGFVSEITEYLDRPNTREIEVKTDELNIEGKSFGSFLSRITDAAQIVKDKQTIYDRAKALTKRGTFGTEKLDGMIDVLQNRLVSTKSNWYTDENGNIMFVSADETNAMMLCGTGFMVANGKDAQTGEWNWRTFGSGEGFTADLITAGVLRAGIITILGSDQFYWTQENLYIVDDHDTDKQIRIGRYDGVNLGIGYTTDGGTHWQNAIDFNGIHLSVGSGGRNYIMHSKTLKDAVIEGGE